jgi:DNA-binding transcriptional regulator YdaS (Cro superfamily)
MKAQFTEAEKATLKGHKKAVANKLGVSHTYVNKIADGEYDINSDLSQKIFIELQAVIELFTPVNQKTA